MKSITFFHVKISSCKDKQKTLRRDCNDKVIELIKGHYSEVVVDL